MITRKQNVIKKQEKRNFEAIKNVDFDGISTISCEISPGKHVGIVSHCQMDDQITFWRITAIGNTWLNNQKIF